ncbi:MAG: WD40/YVTN/BNR-like repeat-containing protein, partial [Ktedonobacterales bacterium]
MPANSIGGVLADPSQPHHLVMWSVATGLYISGDDAQTWQSVSAIQGGVYSVSWVHQTLYAVGDSGVYRSTDDGRSFTLADGNDTYSGVVTSAADPTHAYALTGTSVFASSDSGHSWTATGALSRHPSVLSADPR